MITEKTNRELVNDGFAFAKNLNGDTPVMEIAKMIADLATRLDVVSVRSDALAAENNHLLPKAASELSNAWVLQKYWTGIHAALMHIKMGRISVAQEWLLNTILGPGLEAPELEEDKDIDAWAEFQNRGSISHVRALEIIKSDIPATDFTLRKICADAIDEMARQTAEEWRQCYTEAAKDYANKVRSGEVSNG